MPTIADTLKFANLQMAAEALFNFNATPPGTVLTPGAKLDNPLELSTKRFTDILTDGNLHASKLTSTEAAKFAAQWRVVEHISNTTTGFSGTLFQDKVSGELVLSFRSTEFLRNSRNRGQTTVTRNPNSLRVQSQRWRHADSNAVLAISGLKGSA